MEKEITTIENGSITKFNVTMARINLITEKASTLTIKGLKDRQGLAKVKKTRKFIQHLRRNVESRRKFLNVDILKEMRNNNQVAKFIIKELKPSELYLKAQEKEISNRKEEIRIEKKRIKLEKLQKRIDSLNAYDVAFDVVEVEKMNETEFGELLARAEISFTQRKIARDMETKKHFEEVERLRKENEAFKKVQPEPSVKIPEPSGEINIPDEVIKTINEALPDQNLTDWQYLYKQLNALRLEVDSSIVDDIKKTVDKLYANYLNNLDQ